MQLLVQGLPTDHAQALWAGGPDAHGQPPLQRTAQGGANPCRHCLGLIADGEPKLVLSYRPFDTAHPYAESGPIFLHARACAPYRSQQLPAWFAYLQPALIRGYGHDDWIRYDTGDVVPGSELAARCLQILADPGVAYVHIRSKFNCFQCRVDRA